VAWNPTPSRVSVTARHGEGHYAIDRTVHRGHCRRYGRASLPDNGASLYQAMAIVTGTDLRERPRGFAECFEDVLV
jgi:hypothetical protein